MRWMSLVIFPNHYSPVGGPIMTDSHVYQLKENLAPYKVSWNKRLQDIEFLLFPYGRRKKLKSICFIFKKHNYIDLFVNLCQEK